MSNKSKVKSYARRTKKGISRVTGHDRKSNKSKRNRNIAIGLGIGTSVLALGLGAKHLAKKKGLKGNTPPTQAVSFTPNKPNNPTPKPKIETPSKPKIETPSATVAEVRQTTKAIVDKAKEIKADKPLNPSPSPEVPTNLREATRAAQQARVTIVDESKAKLQKRNDNYRKVLERQGLLMQVEPESKFVMRPYFGANAKMNPNRQLRKKAGKRLADAARDLRSRGMYN